MKRFLWLGFVLFLDLICTGCGDTFRPIIIPNPPTFPNPAAAHTVVAINDNLQCLDALCDNGIAFLPGSAMVIDVSGDSAVSVADCSTPLCLGVAPVHAVQQTASQVLVVNQAVTGLNVPTNSCLVTIPPTPPNQTFNVCSSITKLNFSGTVISSTSSIGLPIYSGANFVAVAPNQTTAYVTLPTYPPDPTQPLNIVPSVGVVSTSINSLVTTIPVVNSPDPSDNPYALAVTPNNTKLYVANNSGPCPGLPGICSISAFNIVGSNLSPRSVNGLLSSPPIWLVARSDNQRVYVLQRDGTLAWLDTTSTAGPDTLTETSISVPGAVKMVYDGSKNRLYIPGGSQVTIVDVSQSTPSTIATLTITPTTPSGCSPIGTAVLSTVDVAALPDGSRAYAGSFYKDASGNFCPQVTVIDARNNTVKNFVAVPGFPAFDLFCSTTRFRIMMAAAGDSSRAYLSSCDGGNVNIVDTSDDTYIGNLTAPASSLLNNPPQNPVFLFAGP